MIVKVRKKRNQLVKTRKRLLTNLTPSKGVRKARKAREERMMMMMSWSVL